MKVFFKIIIFFSFFHLYAMERAIQQDTWRENSHLSITHFENLSQNTVHHIQAFANQDLLSSLQFGPGIDGIQQLSLRKLETQSSLIIQSLPQVHHVQNTESQLNNVIYDNRIREHYDFKFRDNIQSDQVLNIHKKIIDQIYSNPQLKKWFENQLNALIPTIAETFRCPTPFNTILLDLIEFNPERAIDQSVKSYLEYVKEELVTDKILETSWKIKNDKLQFQLCGSLDRRQQCAWSIASYFKRILPPQHYKDTIQSFARQHGISEFAEIAEYQDSNSLIRSWETVKSFPGRVFSNTRFGNTTADQIRTHPQYQEFKTQIILSLQNRVREAQQRAQLNDPLNRMIFEECARRYTDRPSFLQAHSTNNKTIQPIIHTSTTETKQEIEETVELESSFERIPLLEQHTPENQLDFRILDTLQLLGRDINSIENIEKNPTLLQLINKLTQKNYSTNNPKLICFYTALIDNCFTINKLANHKRLTQADYKHITSLSTNKQTNYYTARMYRISNAACERLKETITRPEELVTNIVLGPVLTTISAVDAATGYLLENGLNPTQALVQVTSLYEYLVNLPEEQQDKIIGTLLTETIVNWSTGRITGTTSFRSNTVFQRFKSHPRMLAIFSRLNTCSQSIKQAVRPCAEGMSHVAHRIAKPFKQCLGRNRANSVRPLDYGHSARQYNQLKNALNAEERLALEQQFTNIIKCTKHGLERLLERGFEPEEVKSLITKPDYLKIQNDGAKAFIQKFGDKYRIIVLNEKTGEIVTALKNTTLKKIINLGKNYGWEL